MSPLGDKKGNKLASEARLRGRAAYRQSPSPWGQTPPGRGEMSPKETERGTGGIAGGDDGEGFPALCSQKNWPVRMHGPCETLFAPLFLEKAGKPPSGPSQTFSMVMLHSLVMASSGSRTSWRPSSLTLLAQPFQG